LVKPELVNYQDNPVPPHYAVVQVLEITDSGCEDSEIDFPVEGIITLQEAMNEWSFGIDTTLSWVMSLS
jgi:hypothetical protein